MSAPNLQALLQFTGVKASLFPPNSRYNGIATATMGSGTTTIVYLRRRFVPSPAELTPVQQYTVKQGDRLDNLAAQFLGDPELYWQLCDANGAMRPEDLENAGTTLKIALPQGL
jgi:nucleoid-associated protein YgaU